MWLLSETTTADVQLMSAITRNQNLQLMPTAPSIVILLHYT